MEVLKRNPKGSLSRRFEETSRSGNPSLEKQPRSGLTSEIKTTLDKFIGEWSGGGEGEASQRTSNWQTRNKHKARSSALACSGKERALGKRRSRSRESSRRRPEVTQQKRKSAQKAQQRQKLQTQKEHAEGRVGSKSRRKNKEE
ncbi:hypothetical protein RRG08_018614 [Elysia crispata]|uniref:Uncharacterized protein n=1 Tax=Elysia crispata TaxID=231223 RepID=A0AAE1E4P8_9GAST|nr:hypothetical protein RRG08_018614 [Elysia crispata]